MLQLKANSTSVTVVAKKLGHYAPASMYKDSICREGCCSKRTRPTQSTRPVNNIQDDKTDKISIAQYAKSHPRNVFVDIEDVTVSMQVPHCLSWLKPHQVQRTLAIRKSFIISSIRFCHLHLACLRDLWDQAAMP